MTGDVVYARFPFSDKVGYKNRPAVVISEAGRRLICAAITSRKHRGVIAVRIENWKQAGLTRPSTVRIDSISTFSAEGVRKIGSLKRDDLMRIMFAFNSIINRKNLSS